MQAGPTTEGDTRAGWRGWLPFLTDFAPVIIGLFAALCTFLIVVVQAANWIEGKFDRTDSRMNVQFQSVDDRFQSVDEKLNAIQQDLDDKLDAANRDLERRLDMVEQQQARLEERVETRLE